MESAGTFPAPRSIGEWKQRPQARATTEEETDVSAVLGSHALALDPGHGAGLLRSVEGPGHVQEIQRDRLRRRAKRPASRGVDPSSERNSGRDGGGGARLSLRSL